MAIQQVHMQPDTIDHVDSFKTWICDSNLIGNFPEVASLSAVTDELDINSHIAEVAHA